MHGSYELCEELILTVGVQCMGVMSHVRSSFSQWAFNRSYESCEELILIVGVMNHVRSSFSQWAFSAWELRVM